MADGGKALTREQRLLSWANEVEAQMVGARQELRRARMELAAVQEDARKAREESKKLYARLAESEAARVAAASNLRAAVTANEVGVFFVWRGAFDWVATWGGPVSVMALRFCSTRERVREWLRLSGWPATSL